MSITIKLDTQAGGTTTTLRDVKTGLKDAKAGAREFREEMDKLKGAAGDQRHMAEQLSGVARAWASVSQAVKEHHAALARATEVHNRMQAANAPLVQGFAKVGQAIEHEEEMLKRIKGPVEEYTKDLAALDSLLNKNAISTEQYAKQVTELNRRLRETPSHEHGGGMERMEGIETVGKFVAGAGAAFGLLEMGKQVEELIHESDELQDKYTKLTNFSLKFQTQTKGTNAVIAEQRELAEALKSPLNDSMALFDGVGNATRGLGMSTREQIGLTRALGEEMVTNGKPLGDAAGIIQRLSVALTLGGDAGREFKIIMAQYPGLTKSLAQGFHTTEAGLIKLVEAHKVGLPEILRGWAKWGTASHDEFGKIQKTQEQLREEFFETANILNQQGVPTTMAYSQSGQKLYEMLVKVREGGMVPMNEVLNKVINEVQDGVTEWKAYEDQVNATHAALGVEGLLGAVDALNLGMGQMAQVLDRLGEKYADSVFGRATGHQVTRAKEFRDARLELEALDTEMKSGTLTTHEYQTRYEALMTTLNGGELPTAIKLWHMAHDATVEYRRELETLLMMNKAGQFAPDEFRRVLAQVTASKPVDPLKAFNADVHEAELRKLTETMKKQREEQEKTRAETEEWAKTEKKVADVMDLVQTPQEKVIEQLEELRKLYEGGYLSAELYAKAQKKVAEALGSTSKALTDSWFARLKEYEDETKKTNERVAATFGPVVEEIGKMAAGLETDWHAMVQKMLADMTKMIIMKGLMQALGGNPSLGGGGSAGGAGDIGGALFDLMGKSVTGFDSGGQIVGRGSPGSTDSQLIAFRKNPNENLTISTPGQQANAAMNGSGGGAGGPVVLKNVNVYDAKQAAYEALNSKDGHQLLLNWVAKNADYLRGYLVK